VFTREHTIPTINLVQGGSDGFIYLIVAITLRYNNIGNLLPSKDKIILVGNH